MNALTRTFLATCIVLSLSLSLSPAQADPFGRLEMMDNSRLTLSGVYWLGINRASMAGQVDPLRIYVPGVDARPDSAKQTKVQPAHVSRRSAASPPSPTLARQLESIRESKGAVRRTRGSYASVAAQSGPRFLRRSESPIVRRASR